MSYLGRATVVALLAGCTVRLEPPHDAQITCDATAHCPEGWSCRAGRCSPPDAWCGDGAVDAGEECDDGDAENDDACVAGCVSARCGDGFVQAGRETCDAGPANSDAWADSFEHAHCDTTCSRSSPYCGDDEIDSAHETCDHGSGNSDGWAVSAAAASCNATCSGLAPYCGDGVLEDAVETCDDGQDNTDIWAPSVATSHCNRSCSGAGPHCGDGVMQAAFEQCDDGPANSNDYAGDPAAAHCNAGCFARSPFCGDQVVQTLEGEGCDSGLANSDGYAVDRHCNAACTDLAAAYCGNGVVESIESCDDTNRLANDGCDTACATETGVLCSGAPSRCAGRVTAVTAANQHTCVLFELSTMKCFGFNARGQLGQGDVQPRGDSAGDLGAALPVIDVGAGRTVTTTASGQMHVCGVLDDASVRCWGDNSRGQLGLGDTIGRGDHPDEMGDLLPAVDLGGLALEIAAGGQHTCARLVGGAVKCWGGNQSGQLGLGDTIDRGDTPGEMGNALPAVDLGLGRTALQLAAGADHTCARLDDGSLKCWGDNARGQLGVGDTARRGDAIGEMGSALPAIDLGSDLTATHVVAGQWFTCALLDSGALKCWGYNNTAALGLGDTSNRGDNAGEMGDSLPAVNLGAGLTVSQVVVGNNHACALFADGSLKCWGSNFYGGLGLGDTQTRGSTAAGMGSALPFVSVEPGMRVTSIAAGYEHTCALLEDATVKCWGQNYNGELGLGDFMHRGQFPGEMGSALQRADLGLPW
jgi:cysteine-rich repeat protein